MFEGALGLSPASPSHNCQLIGTPVAGQELSRS